MHTYKKGKLGFTLVELIVVIAIIAILAGVAVPGFTRYIDDARMSNDRQVVAQMNNFLDTYFLTNPNEDLDGSAVKTVINDINGEAFDFTPTSTNAGYFYVSEIERIIVAKYDDIGELDIEELNISPTRYLHTSETRLLSSSNYEMPFSPDQIFGVGKYLLTTSGSIVAEVVDGLYNLPSSSDLESDYNSLVSRVDGMGGFLQSSAHKDDLIALLDMYDPEHTLFVSNSKWNISAPTNAYLDQFERILFAPGIGNIPSFNLSYYIQYQFEDNKIILPPSVKTVEKNSFSMFNNLNTSNQIIYPSSVLFEQGSFTTSQKNSLAIEESDLPLITLKLLYSNDNGITWEVHNWGEPLVLNTSSETMADNTRIRIDLENLPKSTLDSISMNREYIEGASYYIIKVYDINGLYGIAKVPVTIIDLDNQ